MSPLCRLAVLLLSLVAIGALAPDARAGGEKSGSLLIFPYFTTGSNASHDTEITITNTSNSVRHARVLIVRGGCDPFSFFVSLFKQQPTTFSPKDFGIMGEGWILVVETDASGATISGNSLQGRAVVKGSDVPMGAVPAVPLQGLEANDGDDVLALGGGARSGAPNGAEYEGPPAVLVAPRIPSPEDGNRTTLIIDRVDGDLGHLASRPVTFSVDISDSTGATSTINLSEDCQAKVDLADIDLDLGAKIPSRSTGQIRVRETTGGFVVGLLISRNRGAPGDGAAFAGVHNLSWQSEAPDGVLIILPPNAGVPPAPTLPTLASRDDSDDGDDGHHGGGCRLDGSGRAPVAAALPYLLVLTGLLVLRFRSREGSRRSARA